MKLGEIYDFKNAEEAKAFIGKKVMFSDILRVLTESPSQAWEGTLEKVENEALCPFCGDASINFQFFQFFRPVLEEEDLMTHRQLAEWLSRGKGEYTEEDSSLAFCSWNYSKEDEDKPIRNDILVRRWGDTEWSKPTKAVYEEDCK